MVLSAQPARKGTSLLHKHGNIQQAETLDESKESINSSARNIQAIDELIESLSFKLLHLTRSQKVWNEALHY